MKVLEKGTGQKGWAGEFTCTGAGNGGGGCGAKLLVEEADLYHTHNYDYGGGHDTYTTFSCPDCGRKNDIKSPGGIGTIPDSYDAWKKRQIRERAAADPIEEAQQKSQSYTPSRF